MVRNSCKVRREMKGGRGLSMGRGVAGGANRLHLLPHLPVKIVMRTGHSMKENSKHTGRLCIKVSRELSWAVELIVNLNTLWEISVTLT
jgi:hypothetical protein